MNLTTTSANGLTFSGSGVFDIGFASATGTGLGPNTYTLLTLATPEAPANAPSLSSYQAILSGGNITALNGAHFSYATNGTGNITALMLSIDSSSSLPEPTTARLALLALPGLGALTVRRRK